MRSNYLVITSVVVGIKSTVFDRPRFGAYISSKIRNMAEASSEDSTSSTRDRRPNVTLDIDGIQREKSLQCRKTRSATKACITRKIKELTERFTKCKNVADVRKGGQEFEEIATNFRDTHSGYHATLHDDFEIQDSQEYFECENQRIVNFQKDTRRVVLKGGK